MIARCLLQAQNPWAMGLQQQQLVALLRRRLPALLESSFGGKTQDTVKRVHGTTVTVKIPWTPVMNKKSRAKSAMINILYELLSRGVPVVAASHPKYPVESRG